MIAKWSVVCLVCVAQTQGFLQVKRTLHRSGPSQFETNVYHRWGTLRLQSRRKSHLQTPLSYPSAPESSHHAALSTLRQLSGGSDFPFLPSHLQAYFTPACRTIQNSPVLDLSSGNSTRWGESCSEWKASSSYYIIQLVSSWQETKQNKTSPTMQPHSALRFSGDSLGWITLNRGNTGR